MTNHVFPELGGNEWGLPAATAALRTHMVVHDKATVAMMVWGKFEFQNKIQNSEI